MYVVKVDRDIFVFDAAHQSGTDGLSCRCAYYGGLQYEWLAHGESHPQNA